MQWDVIKQMTDTQLIQHNWKTENYRVEDGTIVCSNVEELPYGISFDYPVRGDAVVLHGCKDGSLARLLHSGDETPDASPVEEDPVFPPVNFEENTPFTKKRPARRKPLKELVTA